MGTKERKVVGKSVNKFPKEEMSFSHRHVDLLL